MKRRAFLGIVAATPVVIVAGKYLIDLPAAEPPPLPVGQIGSFYTPRFVADEVVGRIVKHTANYRDYFLLRHLAYGGRVDYGRLKRGPQRDDPMLANNEHFQRSLREC